MRAVRSVCTVHAQKRDGEIVPPMHSGLISGHAAGPRPGGLFMALLQACGDTLRKAWGGTRGEVALTARKPATSPDSAPGLPQTGALRLQLSYADTPLTPGATRVTATAAVLQCDGTDITADFAPSAWTWRQASGLAMRAGYGAVSVDTEGQ